MENILLPQCNLYLVGSGHDTNGNKIIKLTFPNSRGFSIQTNGNLKNTSYILRGLKTQKDMGTLPTDDLTRITVEVCNYIKIYGSATQQKRLRYY